MRAARLSRAAARSLASHDSNKSNHEVDVTDVVIGRTEGEAVFELSSGVSEGNSSGAVAAAALTSGSFVARRVPRHTIVVSPPEDTMERVTGFLKARDAERHIIFSGVVAWAGYCFAVSVVFGATGTALDTFKVFEGTLGTLVYRYSISVAIFIADIGLVLLSTLPAADTFDLDLAMDNRRSIRRVVTCCFLLVTGKPVTTFPYQIWYVVSGLQVFSLLVKLVWDEMVAGCCRCGRNRQREEDPSVRDPSGAGCAPPRPRLTDLLSVVYFGFDSMRKGLVYIVAGRCHAAAAVVSGVNTSFISTSTANMTSATIGSLIHNHSNAGCNSNATCNSTVATCCCQGSDLFRYVLALLKC